jgi:hypothetical protein
MSIEDELIRLELDCRDACSTGDLRHIERVLAKDFVAILSPAAPSERLLAMSRLQWLSAIRRGRIPLFQIEDLIIRLYRRNTMAIVAMIAVEEASVAPAPVDGVRILVTDIWSRASGWTLCERHTSRVLGEAARETAVLYEWPGSRPGAVTAPSMGGITQNRHG